MNIKIYTIDCPQCLIIEKKFKQAGLNYEAIRDYQIFKEKGFMQFPIIEIDGNLFSFSEANKWLKTYKGE